MKAARANEIFIQAIRTKFPKYSEMANKISSILLMDKDLVYRRLRGDVAFTFQEISLLSEKLGISIDNLAGATNSKSRPFYMKMTDYIEPGDIDYFMMDEYNGFLKEIITDPSAEFFMAAKVIPDVLLLQYKSLTKYYFFKWLYQYGAAKKFHEVECREQMSEKLSTQLDLSCRIKNLHFLMDRLLFQNLVDDLLYFKDIRLITPEEIQELQRELFQLMDHMEELADNGMNPAGSKVKVYISGITFDGDYAYIQSQNYRLTLIRIFTLHNITSLDISVFEETKKWMKSLTNSSIMISDANLLARKEFFKTQQKIIQRLDE